MVHGHLPTIDGATQTDNGCIRKRMVDTGVQCQTPDSEVREILNMGERKVLHALWFLHKEVQGTTQLEVLYRDILKLGGRGRRKRQHLVSKIAQRMELEVVVSEGEIDTLSLRLPKFTPDVDFAPITVEVQRCQPGAASTAPTHMDEATNHLELSETPDGADSAVAVEAAAVQIDGEHADSPETVPTTFGIGSCIQGEGAC